ncbi:MAG: hypothetical protein HYZ14_06590 [Bacteroidetes bacterium]|nr:hypothetical protein [Bacteroidota bacterium]
MIGRIILAASFLAMPVAGKSQTSGFLGAVNGITLKVNSVPSYAMTSKIVGSEVISRMKVANLSYTLSYSRVLSRNIEVTAGYQFAHVNFSSGHKWFNFEQPVEFGGYSGNQYYFADHASANYHGGSLTFDFYRFGSLAPVGKYIGLSFSSGVTRVKEDNSLIISDRDTWGVAEGFFSTHYDYNSTDTLVIGEQLNVRSSYLKARIGRNYPVTENLMISVGMSAPLFSTYSINGIKYFGFELRDDRTFDYYENDWRWYTMQSVRVYHRLQFEIGLRLCL